jgi:hypothetical protein
MAMGRKIIIKAGQTPYFGLGYKIKHLYTKRRLKE